MYALRKDTLAGIKTSALFHNRDLSNVPMAQWSVALSKYTEEKSDLAKPEAEAFRFYYANHVWSLISAKFDQHEVMPADYAELARDYVKMSGDIVARLTYYTLMIITREMRHCYGDTKTLDTIEGVTKGMNSYIQLLRGMSENQAVDYLKTNPPLSATAFEYCNAMDKVFEFGGFSGGYGNKPWAVVAETLGKMVKGTLTPEMFADTAFTLCHNNGPIFNKGMLYSSFNKYYIAKLLDVQRSGQVPQLYNDGGVSAGYTPYETNKFIHKAKLLFPEELGGYVDWFKVQALGALGSYPTEQQQQVALHGPSPFEGKGKVSKDGTYCVGPSPTDVVKVFKRKKAKKAA